MAVNQWRAITTAMQTTEVTNISTNGSKKIKPIKPRSMRPRGDGSVRSPGPESWVRSFVSSFIYSPGLPVKSNVLLGGGTPAEGRGVLASTSHKVGTKRWIVEQPFHTRGQLFDISR